MTYQKNCLVVFKERNATKNEDIIEGSLHMKLRYPQCFSTWFRKSPRNETTICFPSLRGSARLAILFFEKTAANLKSILKSSQLSEGIFKRFQEFSQILMGAGWLMSPQNDHIFIFFVLVRVRKCVELFYPNWPGLTLSSPLCFIPTLDSRCILH